MGYVQCGSMGGGIAGRVGMEPLFKGCYMVDGAFSQLRKFGCERHQSHSLTLLN